MDALLSNPGGPAWQDPTLEVRLKERLPKTYNWYLVTIVDFNTVMQKMLGKLGVDGGQVGNPGALLMASCADQSRRIQVGSRRRPIKAELNGTTSSNASNSVLRRRKEKPWFLNWRNSTVNYEKYLGTAKGLKRLGKRDQGKARAHLLHQ